MTDEKDPKETPEASKDAAEAATTEAAEAAKTESVKPAAADAPAAEAAKTESVKPAADAPAAEAAKTESVKPAPIEAPAKTPSVKPAAHAPAKAANVSTPASGVRVTLAYQHGESLETPSDPKSRLQARRLLAEYETTTEVIHAAETLRDAGYKSFEAHTPFPVHGMDAAMGLSDSKLGWIVLMCGLTGVTSAWVMMYWMNGVDYPLVIGGKPPGALPSMVPIMFELTVLLSAFGAVFGMFGLNRLPQHHDVLFYSDRFSAFSNDRFFISVESGDPKFDVTKTRLLLEKTKPESIEVIETIEEVES